MPRGRPRKPTRQHKLEGTFRPRRHSGRTDERLDTTRSAVKPDDLDDEGSRLWDALVSHFPPGVICVADEPALSACVDLWATWTQYKGEDDPQRYYKGLAALKLFTSLASRFGMTPADRAKLELPNVRDPQREDDDDRFFKVVS